MVDVSFISPFNTTTTIATVAAHLAPLHGPQAPRCPSPLLRDVGPLSAGQRAGGGVTKGGTQEVGGPAGELNEPRLKLWLFFPFPPPLPLLTSYAEVTTIPIAGNG